MPATFSEAPEVKSIAQGLIAAHHKHLLQFGVRVEFVFRSDTPKKNGREVWGTARKISSLSAYLARGDEDEQQNETQLDFAPAGADGEEDGAGNEPFFCITISRPVWSGLGEKERAALVDHELMHCDVGFDEKTGDMKLVIRAHDLEGFHAEFTRHGLWRQDARVMYQAMKQADQLPLELEPAAVATANAGGQ